MSALLDATVQHLHALVGFDTRNPPRAIGKGGIFDYLRARLRGFDLRVTDHGAGAVSMYAVRGKPKLLFNAHLDTVPDSPAWTANPFELRVMDDRAVGLGACDIKGAAAALLAVANASDGDLALLFTSDEEGADPRCIKAFLERKPAFDGVLVAEPTRCEAVFAHRGISSVRMRFHGRAGHASGVQQAADNALHQAMRWGAAALDFVESQSRQAFGGLAGLRFNIGRVEGGIKANVIAPECDVRFGFRPLPSMDTDELLRRFHDCAEPAPVEFVETFRGPPLPACDPSAAETRRLAARELADAADFSPGSAVDFWTEASLFSRAGYTALVFGPGDIAQAHSVDEWVALEQLQRYAESVHRIIEKCGQGWPLP